MVWKHANLRNVPLNQRVWVDNSGDGQYDLVINNAQPSDSNIYLCYSSSGIGAAVNKEAYAVFVSMGLTTPTTPFTLTPTTPSTLNPTTVVAPKINLSGFSNHIWLETGLF